MADLKCVTYCGLFCGLCLNAGRIPQTADALRGLLERVHVEEWGPEHADFDAFWRFLAELIAFRDRASCRTHACGIEPCAIRGCAEKREVVACPLCREYPCEKIATLASRYPTLLTDGERMRDLGMDLWVKEQEARKARGFAYVDVRYDSPSVPRDA